ncbi:hypothetical protein ACQY0O_002020 [Thecaphora frezii]
MLRHLFLSSGPLRSAARLGGQASGPSTASTSYLVHHRVLSSTALRLDQNGSTSAAASTAADAVASAAPIAAAADAAPSATPATPASSSTPSTSSADSLATPGRAPAPASLDDVLSSISATSLPGLSPSSSPSPPTIRPRIRSRTLTSTAPSHKLHILSSRNNTILTLTNPEGEPLASSSGGSVGFKKAARSGYEAGYRAAFTMFAKIAEKRDAWRIHNLELLWNGFGQGREAVYRALMAGEGQETRQLVVKMTDKTPIKIGGVRPKKRRML